MGIKPRKRSHDIEPKPGKEMARLRAKAELEWLEAENERLENGGQLPMYPTVELQPLLEYHKAKQYHEIDLCKTYGKSYPD